MDFEAWAIVSALMTAVLHFLWQGALIALLAAAILFVMRRGSAQGRFFVATAALAAYIQDPEGPYVYRNLSIHR